MTDGGTAGQRTHAWDAEVGERRRERERKSEKERENERGGIMAEK